MIASCRLEFSFHFVRRYPWVTFGWWFGDGTWRGDCVALLVTYLIPGNGYRYLLFYMSIVPSGGTIYYRYEYCTTNTILRKAVECEMSLT